MGIRQLVRLLDADPGLGAGLPEDQLRMARRALLAPLIEVDKGELLSEAVTGAESSGLLGLLVLDGLILQRVEVVGHTGVELLSAGDFAIPWNTSRERSTVPARVEWHAAVRTRIALLDDDVHHIVSRFPALLRNIVRRAAARADLLMLNLALGQLTRVDARLLVLFWHLADRFGRVEGDSIVVRLPLSQRTLAELVSARRQTVSAALNSLSERGAVVREPNDRWIVRGRAPATADDVSAALELRASIDSTARRDVIP